MRVPLLRSALAGGSAGVAAGMSSGAGPLGVSSESRLYHDQSSPKGASRAPFTGSTDEVSPSAHAGEEEAIAHALNSTGRPGREHISGQSMASVPRSGIVPSAMHGQVAGSDLMRVGNTARRRVSYLAPEQSAGGHAAEPETDNGRDLKHKVSIVDPDEVVAPGFDASRVSTTARRRVSYEVPHGSAGSGVPAAAPAVQDSNMWLKGKVSINSEADLSPASPSIKPANSSFSRGNPFLKAVGLMDTMGKEDGGLFGESFFKQMQKPQASLNIYDAAPKDDRDIKKKKSKVCVAALCVCLRMHMPISMSLRQCPDALVQLT